MASPTWPYRSPSRWGSTCAHGWREIHTLLNRGESVHPLQRAIHGGQVAPERGRRRQEMAAISGAHALLTNIVLAWNTSRMGRCRGAAQA